MPVPVAWLKQPVVTCRGLWLEAGTPPHRPRSSPNPEQAGVSIRNTIF